MTLRKKTRKKRTRRLILRDKCDRLFSQCVRFSRANGQGQVECYTCGLLNNWKYGMDCGHWISRGRWPTRWHPDNARPQCMACNRSTGRRGETNEMRLAHAKKYGSRFVGGGEPMVFEARLISEGVDTEALTRLSRGPGQTVDEMEELFDELTQMWERLLVNG